MIRIAKSEQVPESLNRTSAYNGEDVRMRLLWDQHSKCYACERTVVTDFEVEHFMSKSEHPDLRQEWRNLLLSCRYCNGKKSDRFDGMLNPLDVNVEDVVVQEVDYARGVARFSLTEVSDEGGRTIEFLDLLFNGRGRMRTIKEKQFFDYFVSVMNRFQGLVCDYLFNPRAENEENVRNELAVDKEFLGFKYWIVKGNRELERVFGEDVVWNKC